MAHFSLETDPFLSMEILVAKEVLEWNHLSVSYSVNWRYLRSFSTSHLWMICPQESSRNREIGSKKKIIHHPASASGVFLRTYRFASNKFVMSGACKAPDSMVTSLPSLQFTGEVLSFVLLLQKWSCSPPRQLSRPDPISQDTAVMEGGQCSVVSV